MCFIHNNSLKCYFYDLLPFGIYLTFRVLPFLWPLSNIFEFYFPYGPNVSSFPIYFSICHVLPMCFILRIYLSYFENMSQNISFSSPSLVFICLIFYIFSVFCSSSEAGHLAGACSWVGKPGFSSRCRFGVSCFRAARTSTFQSIQMGDIKSPRDKLWSLLCLKIALRVGKNEYLAWRQWRGGSCKGYSPFFISLISVEEGRSTPGMFL